MISAQCIKSLDYYRVKIDLIVCVALSVELKDIDHEINEILESLIQIKLIVSCITKSNEQL